MNRIVPLTIFAAMATACSDPVVPVPDPVVAFAPGGGRGGGGDGGAPTNKNGSMTLPEAGSGQGVQAVGATLYAHGECGVGVTMHYESGSRDLRMQTDNPAHMPKGKTATACGWPRQFTVVRDGVAESGPGVINVRQAGFIAVGETRTDTPVAINAGGACGRQIVQASATRTNAEHWSITFVGGSAVCEGDGSVRAVAGFTFTATISGAVE